MNSVDVGRLHEPSEAILEMSLGQTVLTGAAVLKVEALGDRERSGGSSLQSDRSSVRWTGYGQVCAGAYIDAGHHHSRSNARPAPSIHDKAEH